MALGTINVTPKVKQGPIRADLCEFTGDDAYPTGGSADFSAAYRDALEAAGFSSPGREILGVIQVDGSGHVLRYNDETDKLMAFIGAAGPLAEVAAVTDLSAQSFRCVILSI